MGYKTWSENSCAVRASQPANEKQRLVSPTADSPPNTLFFFLKRPTSRLHWRLALCWVSQLRSFNFYLRNATVIQGMAFQRA